MNITVDYEPLAKGIYEMIKEHPDGACLKLGMFPAGIMAAFEKSLKEKIPDHFLDRETLEIIDGKEIRRNITHNVCCKILSLAEKENFLIV